MLTERRLLALLADGEFHSGEKLANGLGISRTAVWKHLTRLREKNLDMHAVRGRGYRLTRPVELLDQAVIRSYLDPAACRRLAGLRIYYETDSTNQVLMNGLAAASINGQVVLAEHQLQGRGRGGNQWLSAPAAGLALSIGWHFDSAPSTLSALSLATGVVLAKSLRESGARDIHLKWPNDLVHEGAKLGGILIESRGQLAGSVDVIIGIGLNVDLPAGITAAISQEVTDMVHVLNHRPSRNRLAGTIIGGMLDLLGSYDRRGFESYIREWREMDYTRDKFAVLRQHGENVSGQVVDIDDNGNLVLSIDGKLQKFSSGDLSLRVMH